MQHLTLSELDALADDIAAAPQARAHLASCALCAWRFAEALRLERELAGLDRVAPAADLSSRIIAALPQAAVAEGSSRPWLGTATLVAALLGLALAYQTAFDLRASGAFDLVSYYAAQPEIVLTYPAEAWSALAPAIPWALVGISSVVMSASLYLVVQWAHRSSMRTMVGEGAQ